MPEVWIPTFDMVARLSIALVFGAVVGWEREHQARPAGLRTHILVALGAAGFTMVALTMMNEYLITPEKPIGIDPVKIIAGIVGGVGFLGAGSIFQSKAGGVHGMTTAAGIWVVASVGVAAGAGYYALAGLLVLFTLFTLQTLRYVSHRIEKNLEDADDK
ncbi:MAG: MgtC/SapB family protein [Phycisphaerales bacterium]